MAYYPSHFKPVYQADCEPACGMKLFGPPFTIPTAKAWCPGRIDRWLVDTGFGRYRRNFREHNISGENLLNLGHSDLRRMGINDRGDAAEMAWNIHQLCGMRRPVSTEDLPGPPYTHYRALCFGEQPPVITDHKDREPVHYRNTISPDNLTSRRVSLLAGDKLGWFERNRPHPFI